MPQQTASNARFSRRLVLQVCALATAAASLPLLLYLVWDRLPASGEAPPARHAGSDFVPSPTVRFTRRALGPEPVGLPRIANVQIVDMDRDGRQEILVCDVGRSSVLLYRPAGEDQWSETILGQDLGAPAHATPCDFDGDGDTDVLVALLGNLLPDDRAIGSVVLLENTGESFERRVILDDVRRVADVQPGDFDGDGDLDLAVAVFGYSRGQVLWLENLGGLRFRKHELHSAPGAIHVPVADLDGDGDLDIAAIVTQDEEELWAFENLGEGRFRKHLLHRWWNFDIGGAGLVAADLDSDGDMDLIVPVGDNLEDLDPYPQPYHGCFWLENQGGWKFELHRIAHFGGTYAAAVADLNHDGAQDIVLVSMANNFRRPGNASIIWLENDGHQNFTPRKIDEHPTHFVTVACGDLNGDGRIDVLTGGLHLRGPYTRIGRLTAWFQQEPAP